MILFVFQNTKILNRFVVSRITELALKDIDILKDNKDNMICWILLRSIEDDYISNFN